MADRPVLFSGPMVRALLDGRKTQTRRVLTRASGVFGSAPIGFWEHGKIDEAWPDPGLGSGGYLHVPCHLADDADTRCQLCEEMGWAGTVHRFRPRVRIGNRLWVREAWRPGYGAEGYREDLGRVARPADFDPTSTAVEYLADGTQELAGKKRPGIHMPRWASRLTLLVTDVRVQRLQDISEEDALAEGVDSFAESLDRPGSWEGLTAADRVGMTQVLYGSARRAFQHLWEQIHGTDAWSQNPWVSAMSFTVRAFNIDAPEPAVEQPREVAHD